MGIWQTLVKSIETLGDIRPGYAAVAIGLYGWSVILCGFRWKKVLAGLGCQSRLTDTSLGILIGIFVNNITPSSRVGGEISRIALIRRWAKIDLKKATVSIFYDRLVMIIPFLLLIALSIPNLLHLGARFGRPVGVLSILVLILIGLFLICWKVARIREWISSRLKILTSFRIDRNKMIAATGISAVIWIQDFLRLMVVAAAFGVILNPFQAATLSVVIFLCSFVPSLGGLGPTEGGLTAALHLFGVGLETAIAITIAERAISYVLSTCAGSLSLAAIGGRKLLLQTEAQ